MLLKIGFYLIYRFVLYFLAFNSKPADLPRLAVIFGRRQLDAFLFLFDIACPLTGAGFFIWRRFPTTNSANSTF